MSVVSLLWRTRLRSSWRAAVVALVVLIGLGGGAALSVAAGARRTASAFEAVLEKTNAYDLAADYGPGDPSRIEALVRGVEGVVDTTLIVGFGGFPAGDERNPITILGYWSDPITVGRPVLTAGRLPIGPSEAMLNKQAAAVLGWRPGDHIDIVLSDATFSEFEPVGLDIVGVGVLAGDLIEDERAAVPFLQVTRGFTERHVQRAWWGQAEIDVGPDGDTGAVASALAANGIFVDEDLNEDRQRVQDSLRPLLLALAGLASLAGIATAVVAGQALTRIVRRPRADDRSLRAIGATTGQLVGADLIYASTVGLAGSVVAAGLALTASPLFPVGPLRDDGRVGGVSADFVVLGAGSVALVLAIAGLVGIGSRRRRASSRPTSPGRVPGILASRPASATGLRLASAQRGLVGTVAGVAAGMSVVVACGTFTGSLDRLVDDPALVGMSWDVGARSASRFAAVDTEQLHSVVRDDPAFDRVTGLKYLVGTVDGTVVPLAVFGPLKGNPWPPIEAGRAPVAAEEVLVGRATLDDLGVEIGDRITISLPVDDDAYDPGSGATVQQSYSVVGSAVTPAIGEPGQYTPKLAVGILMSPEGLGTTVTSGYQRPQIVLFGVSGGVGADVVFDRFPDGLPFQGEATEWFRSATPAEVSQAAGARTVISIAVGALAVAIVATVVHALLGSVRQRRREYAVLKAIGFTRRQVRATVLWQSGAMAGLAIALALPLGIGAGRSLWRAFAEDVGIVTDPTVPVLLLAAFVFGTFAAVQSAAMLPATIARRAVVDRSVRPE